jgi:hypothetical protein
MAEGLLGGILGGEDEEKTASTKAGPEAFVAAVAANIANQSPEVAAETVALFRDQRDLLKAQRRSVEAEHGFFEVEWGPRLLGIRLRIAFQIFIALVAIVIGIGVAIMIRDAVTSRRVVIEPFDAPPALAARGLTGKVCRERSSRRTQPSAGCHPEQFCCARPLRCLDGQHQA